MNYGKQRLKILIPVFGFAKSGGYRVLSKLANNWIDMGHNVTFVSHFGSIEPYFQTKANIIWLDKKGIELGKNIQINSSGILTKIYCIFSYIKKHSREYDIVIANHNLTAFPVALGSKANNYYYIQAYEPEFYSKKSLKNKIGRFIAWLTYFLPLTRIVNADIYKKYKNIRSSYVIPPGLDMKVYYPKELGRENKKELTIGCIGRIEEWKGSHDVGSAVKILNEKGYNVKFKVAFNPVNYQNHELVYPNGDSNLSDYYRSLDVLVAPGHIQLGAIHYPVIEAMACNVPVITTGYYPANKENSFIVPIKSPDKIANELEVIIKDYSIAYDKAEIARCYIHDFDWNKVSNKFIEVFYTTMNSEHVLEDIKYE